MRCLKGAFQKTPERLQPTRPPKFSPDGKHLGSHSAPGGTRPQGLPGSHLQLPSLIPDWDFRFPTRHLPLALRQASRASPLKPAPSSSLPSIKPKNRESLTPPSANLEAFWQLTCYSCSPPPPPYQVSAAIFASSLALPAPLPQLCPPCSIS